MTDEERAEAKRKYNRDRYHTQKAEGFSEEFKQGCREASRRHHRKHPQTEEQRKAHADYMREYWNKNRERLNKERNAKRKADKGKYRKQQNDWDRTNPERKIFTAAKARAKKYALEFTITLTDITPFPTHCPVLGIELRKGTWSDDPYSYSIDRIDNSKGYVPGNIAIISRRANVLKRDGSLAEIKAIVAWLEKQGT